MKRVFLSIIVIIVFILPAFSKNKANTISVNSIEQNKIKIKKIVNNTVNNVLDILKQKKLTRKIKINNIMKVIEPVFNFKLMAKLTLGRKYWFEFDKKQRKKFTILFIKQLQNTYYDLLEKNSKEKIFIEEPIKKRKRYYVTLKVKSKDETVKILYKIYKKKSQFRIYDMVIQGVSLIKSYHSQYSEILDKKGPKGLIKKMEKKLN